MGKKKKVLREWVEPKNKIIIPTLKEKIEKGISDKDWIMMCYKKYKKTQCLREFFGHNLCELCPKAVKREQKLKLSKEIATNEEGILLGSLLTQKALNSLTPIFYFLKKVVR